MNICLNCQKETKNPKFCSMSCSGKYNNKLIPKRHKTKKCKQCDILINSNKTYCKNCWDNNKSLICSIKTKKYKSIRQNGKRISIPIQICKNCGKLAVKYFCCKQCHIDYTFLQRVKQIELSGIIYPNTKFNTRASFAKRYLKYKFEDKCSICGIISQWNNKNLVLVLDHINGQSNDWSITNLRLVCPNCDSQLPTFKSKNRGKGRPCRIY